MNQLTCTTSPQTERRNSLLLRVALPVYIFSVLIVFCIELSQMRDTGYLRLIQLDSNLDTISLKTTQLHQTRFIEFYRTVTKALGQCRTYKTLLTNRYNISSVIRISVLCTSFFYRVKLLHFFFQTFCVVSKRFRKNYIHRFTATKSFFMFSPWNSFRQLCIYISTNQIFDYVVMTTILLNCVFLAKTDSVEEAE